MDEVGFVAPRNPLEMQVCDIFKSVLNLDRVSIYSNFFEIGGHSLLAGQLISRIKDSLSIDLPLSRLFDAPTVVGLADSIAAYQKVERRLSSANLEELEQLEAMRAEMQHKSTKALSYNQRSLWFMSSMDSAASIAYNISFTAKMPITTDIPSLKVAFIALSARHEILRTTYAMDVDEGEPVFTVHEDTASMVDLQEINARSWSKEQLQTWMYQETYTPFELEKGPMSRVRIIRSSNNHYLLHWTVHHISVDLWSMVILLRDLKLLYEHAHRHITEPLPAPLNQYSEHVRHQLEIMNSQQGTKLWAYWQEQMCEPLPVMQLPIDKPRPPVQTYKGTSHLIVLPAAVTSALKALAHREAQTLYAVLLASFHVLLHKYSGQDDIIVGSPMACRNKLDVEDVVGYFVNPVPLRANLAGDPSFVQFLSRVRETVLGALMHQDMPFTMLVELLKPTRDPSRSPLFQHMFVLQKPHQFDEEGLAGYFLGKGGIKLELGSLHLESIDYGQQHAQFDLTLMMAEVKGELLAAFHYNTDLYLPSTIERMAQHYLTLVQSIVASPHAAVGSLNILPEEERTLVLHKFNDTATPFPKDLCVHELVEAQVARTPSAPAVTHNDKTLTYEELNAQANSLAHYLRFLGVTAEVLVPVFMNRGIDLIVALLAVLKSGGTCMPLDPKYPKDRLEFMFEDANATVLLTEKALTDRLPNKTMKVIVYDEMKGFINGGNTRNPINEAVPDNLAYAIYTSGSTGKPKGVMLRHISLVNYVSWHIPYYHMTPADRVAHMAGLAFDACMAETWGTLIAGACIYPVTDEDVRVTPSKLIRWWADNKITMTFLTTQLAEAILEESYPPDLVLRVLYTGGDKLHRGPSVDAPFKLVNIYGPTECTINATMLEVPKGQLTPPSIGYVVPNTQCYVTDSRMQPVPIGVYGELYISGVQLARGYFRRDDLTQERFIRHAFNSAPDAKMYKTGDLVRWRVDGSLEFFGRIDTQVKIRGFRIELGEVQDQVSNCGIVQAAQVIVYERPGSETKRLYAFVTLNAEHKGQQDLSKSAASKTILDTIKAHLPDYMVPQVIIVDQFPLTNNGKVDRAALPALIPDDNGADDGKAGGYIPPSTEMESRMCSIWEEILHTKQIGMSDNWYDRGGSSLTSTMLLSRMRQVFQMEINLQQFFADPTVRGLMRIVEEKGDAAVASNINVQLDADAEDLDPYICGDRPGLQPYSEGPEGPAAVFLTGATGFLGASLLFDLLIYTKAQVYCLVRASSENDASRRLVENLAHYELLETISPDVAASYLGRVIPVVGNLDQPNFGLSSQKFEELCQLIDVVFHNGAAVNFAYPYVSLKAANVGGTVTGLRLATTHRLKPFHFVSTLSVVPTPDDGGEEGKTDRVVTERPLGKAGHDLHGGYTQSKWVAEKLVALAGARRVPVTIHRPGRITGNTHTGATNVDDFLNLLIQGCLQLKSIPTLDMPCEMMPVDFCARAIVSISLRRYKQLGLAGTTHHHGSPLPWSGSPTANDQQFGATPPSNLKDSESLPTIFHLTNESAMPWEEVMKNVLKHGGYDAIAGATRTDLEWMPFQQWRLKRLLKLKGDSHCILLKLVPMLGEEYEREAKPLDTKTTNTKSMLAKDNLSCPETNEQLIATYTRYFVRAKFLPNPREVAENSVSNMINN
eukprot:GILJ01014062.1.p1 GENE.GILJ01014062.1~~GILJ01014062.1.p1  ORF type:complete len:1671 (+),score=278.21 GILJ01014062.1:31-5013(+)